MSLEIMKTLMPLFFTEGQMFPLSLQHPWLPILYDIYTRSDDYTLITAGMYLCCTNAWPLFMFLKTIFYHFFIVYFIYLSALPHCIHKLIASFTSSVKSYLHGGVCLFLCFL